MLEQKIEQDLKNALLDSRRAEISTLRGLKSVILYAKVAAGKKDSPMADDDVVKLLNKEAKKRQESADLYTKGGDKDRANSELQEKIIIERYLPEAMPEDEIAKLVDAAVKELGADNKSDMGRVIGAVKQRTKGAADGAVIAKIVKERLE